MKLAVVKGRAVATKQDERAEGFKLLLIQPLCWDSEKENGDELVAVDCVGAGNGEKVFFVQSREALVAIDNGDVDPVKLPPVDAAIVGIVEGYQNVLKGK
jgi:microcompartment protein CcmK/EutM